MQFATQVSHNCFSSRLYFGRFNKQNDSGVLIHSRIIALVLRLFGLIVTVQDQEGKTYYINKISLNWWLKAHHADPSLPTYIERINKLCVPKLTVWIRAGGTAVKSEIPAYIQKVLETLPYSVNSEIMICTNEGDTILEELKTITKTTKLVKIIFSQLNSFSKALIALAKNTDPESTVLSLSVGVNIRKDQIETGLASLKNRVKAYGWKVTELENDGSVPGKGLYNTAALFDKTIVKQMREGGVPEWVDNGVLGKIGKHTIGGNEEIPIMIKAIEKEPEAQFILNINDPVSTPQQTGTGISFQEKLERKTIVGDHYMRKMYQEWTDKEVDFESWNKSMWRSLVKV